MKKDKWIVYGKYGGSFTNIKDAKKCAKEASTLNEDKNSEVWLIKDGCNYIEYREGKIVRDGWTIQK